MLSNSVDRFNGVLASLAIKAPCVAVATGNITLSGLQTVGGVVLASEDRVLCIGQTDPIENGIYDVDTSAWSRSADFDGNRDVVSGTFVTVATATVGRNPYYQVTTANPITIGTTAINFTLADGPNVSYALTAAEIAAGLTDNDIDDSLLPGDTPRYGTTGDGVTDDSADANTSLSVDQPVHFTHPSASYLVSTGISTTFGAVQIRGDGIGTRIHSDGANHTFTISAGDDDIELSALWIDQTLGSGAWDAIHVLASETRIRYIDIDDASRYAIYVGAFRTQISHVQVQAALDTGIHIIVSANLNNISDVNFVIAGPKIPGRCINVLSNNNTIANVIADQCIGYVLNLGGSYNTASNISARQPGGATANDFIRIAGAFNTLVNASVDSPTGKGLIVSGNANKAESVIVEGSTDIGVDISGNDNEVEARVFNAGAGAGSFDGISVSGTGNQVRGRVNSSSGDDLSVSAADNTVTGRFQGVVTLTAGALRTTLDLNAGSLVVTSGAVNCDIRGTFVGNTGTVVSIAANVTQIGVRVTNGGAIGCQISGNSAIGHVSVFGSSDVGVEIDGNDSVLQVYSTGATNEELRIDGSNNVVTGHIVGDVVVNGDGNVINAHITGNITFNVGGDNNRLHGFVGGSITDSGTGNNTANVT